jgi:hypothetical protein
MSAWKFTVGFRLATGLVCLLNLTTTYAQASRDSSSERCALLQPIAERAYHRTISAPSQRLKHESKMAFWDIKEISPSCAVIDRMAIELKKAKLTLEDPAPAEVQTGACLTLPAACAAFGEGFCNVVVTQGSSVSRGRQMQAWRLTPGVSIAEGHQRSWEQVPSTQLESVDIGKKLRERQPSFKELRPQRAN